MVAQAVFTVHGIKTVREGGAADDDYRDAELAGSGNLFLVVSGFTAFIG